jgi:class 3 adenylate cyclase
MPTSATEATQTDATLGPAKILVVDDEPDIEPLVRQKFRRQIRKNTIAFVFAADGIEALERLAEHPDIDVVVTDINMPRMDGLALLRKLAEMKQRLVKAIVVTAYNDMDNIRTAMNEGAFDFLTKPLNLSDLEITLAKAQETIRQQKRAAQVRSTFGRYLSDEIVATLLESPEQLRLGGEKRSVTIMMSDLRGFSTISESLEPERVVEILNIYLGKMTEIITEHKGTIDEFIGDAILALFGAPIQREDDALRAVACAVAMQRAMADVNADLEERGLPSLEMGIGVNTGEVVVGNIGSTTRAKYGVVGSHVNLTARIESYTVGGQILISEGTLEEVRGAVEIGQTQEFSTKGFSEPVHIYEVEAVGAGYDLRVPKPESALLDLAEPIPVTFTALDGKHMTADLAEGEITALSQSSARMRTSAPPAALTNLKLDLPSPQRRDKPLGDLYAKVTQVHEGGEMTLRFTAVPEEVAEAIRSFIGS